MVNALIQIDAETNRILNTVKAKNGLRDKGQAVMHLAKEYAGCPECAGRQFKPEFLARIREAAAAMDRGEGISYGSLDGFNRHFDAIRTEDKQKGAKAARKARAEGAAAKHSARKKN